MTSDGDRTLTRLFVCIACGISERRFRPGFDRAEAEARLMREGWRARRTRRLFFACPECVHAERREGAASS